ncbi:MAG: hypothetical protein U1E87_09670 [Alphaproteobacteria bacterium]
MRQLKAQSMLGGLGLCLAATLLCACDPPGPTSVNALAPSVESGGRELMGAWYGELNGNEAFVHVVEGDDGNLRTVVIGRQGPKNEWGVATVIPAKINNTTYLSVKQELGKNVEQDYLIVRFRTSRDKRHISIYAMDTDMIVNAIKNHAIEGKGEHENKVTLSAEPEELVRFIETNAAQDLFSAQVGYLERVSEDDIPPIDTINKL